MDVDVTFYRRFPDEQTLLKMRLPDVKITSHRFVLLLC